MGNSKDKEYITRIRALEQSLTRTTANLIAAVELLKSGGKAAKKAAPSDKMFDQMVIDYEAAAQAAKLVLKDFVK